MREFLALLGNVDNPDLYACLDLRSKLVPLERLPILGWKMSLRNLLNQ